MSNWMDQMDRQGFEALIGAYGAEPRRWPEERRSAAASFAETAEGKSLLASVTQLDAAMNHYELPGISAVLRARVLASGARTMTAQRWLRRCMLGATMIGLSLAGGLSGAAAVMMLVPSAALVSSEGATAFGNLQSDDPREIP